MPSKPANEKRRWSSTSARARKTWASGPRCPSCSPSRLADRMRFALLGNHPDGVALAEAIRTSGRHQLSVCAGLAERPPGWEEVKAVSDIEEILADPAIE